jgi:hypothetical protein
MYPACLWRVVLLAMMRYAAFLSYKTPRLCKSHLSNQVSGTPFDCSFILTCPVQTSVGELDLVSYVCLELVA